MKEGSKDLSHLNRRNFLQIVGATTLAALLPACKESEVGEQEGKDVSGENLDSKELVLAEYATALAGLPELINLKEIVAGKGDEWILVKPNGNSAVYYNPKKELFLKAYPFGKQGAKVEAELLGEQAARVFGGKPKDWVNFVEVGTERDGYYGVLSKPLGVNLREALKKGIISDQEIPEMVSKVFDTAEELKQMGYFNKDINWANVLVPLDESGHAIPNHLIIIDWSKFRRVKKGGDLGILEEIGAYRKLIRSMNMPNQFAEIYDFAEKTNKEKLVRILQGIAEIDEKYQRALAHRLLGEKVINLPPSCENKIVDGSVLVNRRIVTVVTTDGKTWLVGVENGEDLTEKVLRKAGVVFPKASVNDLSVKKALELGGRVVKVGGVVVAVAWTGYELYNLANLGSQVETRSKGYCMVDPNCYPHGQPDTEVIEKLVKEGLENSPAMNIFQGSIDKLKELREKISLSGNVAHLVLDNPQTIGLDVFGIKEENYATGIIIVFGDENDLVTYFHPESGMVISTKRMGNKWHLVESDEVNGEGNYIEYSLVLKGSSKDFEVLMRMELSVDENGKLIETHVPVALWSLSN